MKCLSIHVITSTSSVKIMETCENYINVNKMNSLH